jgi:hypothetical protein
MGKYSNAFFSETTIMIKVKLYMKPVKINRSSWKSFQQPLKSLSMCNAKYAESLNNVQGRFIGLHPFLLNEIKMQSVIKGL